LTENRNILDAIAKTLIEKEKITGIEMLDLIKNIKPELVTDDAIKAVKEMMKPLSDQ
jgi:phage terminase small subunit